MRVYFDAATINADALLRARKDIFIRSGGREMTASLPRRKQPRVVNAGRELTTLQDGTRQARVQGALLRECDEALDRLMQLTHQTSSRRPAGVRFSAAEVQYIEHMVGQIVATVPAGACEKMGKVAIYREYADFSDRRPELLVIMLRAACDEMERELLATARHTIGES
ncbi:hypothetical protein [Methylosinus trichosporium]|nr:hypothetical protein [Methylosinus trichosporium]